MSPDDVPFGKSRIAAAAAAPLATLLIATLLWGCSSPTPPIIDEISVVTADPDYDLMPTVIVTDAPEGDYPPAAPSSTPLPEGYIAPDR
jgi:hypothetical protein